ncbi:lecithin retinol acyltransferase family protein [Prochlorothrix hollandica]|uniref:lecithin retinol acyltransferase family protein n=1 Tax=Prochlorothrix hollandica TaxID=1223 RepID=UPI00333F54A0
MKSKKCGKGYIPVNRKCRKGLGSAPAGVKSAAAPEEGSASRTPSSRSPVASQRASLKKGGRGKSKLSFPGGNGTKVALGLTLGLAGAGGGAGAIVYRDLGSLGLTKDDVKMVSTPEEIAAANEEYNQFKVGDVLVNTFQGLPGRYAQHYAVYGGKDENGEHIVYEAGAGEGTGPTFLKRKAHEEGRPRGKFSKIKDSKPPAFSEQEIIKRAESLVGLPYEYETVTSNCESLARGITYGDFSSSQGEKMSAVTKVLSRIAVIPANKTGNRKRVPASDIAKMMGPGGSGIYVEPGSARKDAEEFRASPSKLRTPENFYKNLESTLKGSSPELKKIAETSALKSYLSIAIVLKKMGREDLLPDLSEAKADSGKTRKFSRNGKVKKKIRGKDGVLRTYWVDPDQKIPGGEVERRIPGEKNTSFLKEFSQKTTMSVAVGAASAIILGSGKKFVSEFEKAAVTDPQKEKLIYTETGMPDERDLLRHSEEMVPGDLIRKSFGLGHKDFFHYGVYAGKDEKTGEHMIYEVGAPGEGGVPSSKIIKSPMYPKGKADPNTSLFERVPDEEMYAKGKDKATFSREEILKRAESMVGNDFDYAISKNNCESFARLVVEGKHYTLQGPTVAPAVKATFDLASSTVTRMSREKGATVITPQQAIDYLEKFSQRKEGESYPFSKFLKEGKSDSAEETGLVPLDQAIREFRASGGGKGNLQRKAEQEIISRYFLLLSAMYTGKKDAPKTDSVLAGRARDLIRSRLRRSLF